MCLAKSGQHTDYWDAYCLSSLLHLFTKWSMHCPDQREGIYTNVKWISTWGDICKQWLLMKHNAILTMFAGDCKGFTILLISNNISGLHKPLVLELLLVQSHRLMGEFIGFQQLVPISIYRSTRYPLKQGTRMAWNEKYTNILTHYPGRKSQPLNHDFIVLTTAPCAFHSWKYSTSRVCHIIKAQLNGGRKTMVKVVNTKYNSGKNALN